MKKLFIVTMNSYPEGDAGAVRQHYMAKIFMDLGYDVTVIGYGNSNDLSANDYDGIHYYSLKTANKGTVRRFICRLNFKNRTMKIIKQSDNIGAILVVDVLPMAFHKICAFAKKKNIKLIHDSVEWYSPEEFSLGVFSPQYILKNITNKHIIKNDWNVIAISSYLCNYFSERTQKAIRMPVIMDVKKIVPGTVETTNNVVKFVYAGAPGKKDYLKDIVDGFALLPQEKLVKIELHIVGITKSQLINICGASENSVAKLGQSLILYGRVPREKALEILQNANYSVLLRNPVLRYAQAGFPTKVVESLAAGTPVLCNMSSDLELYLKDGINAVISSGFEPELFCEAIKKAIDIDFDQYAKMRLEARKTAEENFDYRNYADQFVDFLK